MSANDFAPYAKVLKCGCVLHAEFPLSFEGNVRIDLCKLHAGAGALRNLARWIETQMALGIPPYDEMKERVRYALEEAGDKV